MDEENILDEELSNIIILNDENGNEVQFEFLDLIEYESEEYVVLLPITEDEEEDGEVVILKVEDTDSEEEENSGCSGTMTKEWTSIAIKKADGMEISTAISAARPSVRGLTTFFSVEFSMIKLLIYFVRMTLHRTKIYRVILWLLKTIPENISAWYISVKKKDLDTDFKSVLYPGEGRESKILKHLFPYLSC